MHEIEIAGLKIYYRNVADLNAKLIALLKGIHGKRVAAETSFETFRKQEERIRKFLGGSDPVDIEPTSAKALDGELRSSL